jgi:hypothetical protein
MKTTVPQLSIEVLESGLLRLENERDGNTLDVHPVQVRLMAEQLGLLPPQGQADLLAKFATKADHLAQENVRLKCNMIRVRELAQELRDYIADSMDWSDSDPLYFTAEVLRANMLVSAADMATDDFIDEYVIRAEPVESAEALSSAEAS